MEHREIPLASYPERRRVEELTEDALALVLASRRALVTHGGAYGRRLESDAYRGDPHSSWQLFAVSGLESGPAAGIATVVLWNEVDDGRFSFHFAPGESEPRFFCYEN